ncbi:MAG: hypothetical protein KBB01_05755 [Candidatus Omnitrophica bacterium]|jgi:hypothetical protein|nr:hypothetical protein [Candidatus Omnitrophota bacterium]
MFGQFSNYSEIRWRACAATQGYSHLDKIQIMPDLDNFKLEKFKDLRMQPVIKRDNDIKIMLMGSSKTNIFIIGPDPLLDKMILRLPKYVSKSWVEIKNMHLERDTLSCKNAFSSLCDPQVIGYYEIKPLKPGEPVPEMEFEKEYEICAKCKNFEFKLEENI